MLRTGKECLKSLRDGRVVYIGSEKVDDVTRHPAFRNAAATAAAIYDMKADPANPDTRGHEEAGGARRGEPRAARGDAERAVEGGGPRPPLHLFSASAHAR